MIEIFDGGPGRECHARDGLAPTSGTLENSVMLTVERATEATIGEWVAMRAALWPHAARPELEQEAASLLVKKPAAVAFLLRDDAAPIGLAEATVRVDYVNGCSTSPVGFLEGLYVRPQSRRRGAARLLCRAVEAWASEQGCRELASDTEIDNETSQATHEALGFAESERVVCYVKSIA
jgi:aminoglycoside 6'-N-acetyltransferase I